MVDFELILARLCDAFWVTIRNLILVYRSRLFFTTISCSLISPGDHDRSPFSVLFSVGLELYAENNMDKFLFPHRSINSSSC